VKVPATIGPLQRQAHADNEQRNSNPESDPRFDM